MVSKKCRYCGKEVKIPPSRNNQDNYFCNMQCYKKYRETNIYMKFDNYYKIIVFTPKYGEQQIIIDIDDFDKVKTYHWYIKDGYPSANIMLNGCRKAIRLHRLILNYFDKLYIDHINHNKLDNRKCNLNIVSASQNQQNLKPKKNGYRGVYKSGKKFKSSIRINGKDIYLGTFDTFEDAKKARINAENKYFDYKQKITKAEEE
jgi:hypothetical protein